MRVVVFAFGTAVLLLPSALPAHLPPEPITPGVGGAVSAPEAPGTDAPAAAVAAAIPAPPAQTEAQINIQAARLGLGSRATANVLLIGGPRADWIQVAGGSTAPVDLLWPLDNGRLLRGYGTGRRGRHRALDIGAPEGTEIHAAERGLVAYADRGVRGYGNLTMIVHPGGWVTYYAHASELLVRPGQWVDRGQTIARVGHTGRAAGDHLHFELRREGAKVDPAPFLVRLLPGQQLAAARQALPVSVSTRRIRRGDTLQRIANRSGVTLARLMALNGLTQRSHLRIGQNLLIPPSDAPRIARGRARHRRR